ncbi:PREDICTED: uncharacterized protein LOC108556595, partial [Nicrophorus vespilloides]|uniref:Uncharacterized protein LOC108556595 n=1 Tax=Nicrophorus vespilloides TaxID=110193 RepID=A0ABM1M104_NICVS
MCVATSTKTMDGAKRSPRFRSVDCLLPVGGCWDAPTPRDDADRKPKTKATPIRRATIGQFPWRRRGTESLSSSPGLRRRTPTETSQTAPVTPLHDSNRRRSPVDGVARRVKATSTPLLLDPAAAENRKWKIEGNENQNASKENRKSIA